MGYGGKYTQVKEAVRELTQAKPDVFGLLIHRPGETQGERSGLSFRGGNSATF
jgi:hypothetical protein